MTLLFTLFAAIISTFFWYLNAPEDKYRVRTLCFMFWGASLMWFVDAIFSFVEDGAAYFHPEPAEMLNDAFLGLSVIALAGVIWIIDLLAHDPKRVVKSILSQSKTAGSTPSVSSTNAAENV